MKALKDIGPLAPSSLRGYGILILCDLFVAGNKVSIIIETTENFTYLWAAIEELD